MQLILIFILLMLCPSAWAVNYCNDANNKGCWTHTEGSGTTLGDHGANTTNNGTFQSSGHPTWSSSTPNAQYNFVTVYNGTSDYVDVPTNTSLNFAANQDFTICVWEKTSDTSNFQDILQRYDPSTNAGQGYAIRNNGSGNSLDFTVFTGSGNSATIVSNATTGTGWNHVCGTRSGSTLQIYVNASASSNSQTGTSPNGDTTGANDLFIGSNYLGSGSFFTGSLTGIAIFNRALSGTEITDIFNNGLTGGGGGGGGGTPNFGAAIGNAKVINGIIN